MSDIIDAEGYRANVGIILLRESGQVFLGRRTGNRGWQFPQGGMRRGERLEEAVYRELQEETGLQRPDVRLIGRTTRWLHYRLPARYIRRKSKPLCIGQKQRWFLLGLAREDVAFRLDDTDTPEFDEWRWVNYWEPVREIVPFKRAVYARALEELAPLAFPGRSVERPPWWDEMTNERKTKPVRS